jgi:hypothetical protein
MRYLIVFFLLLTAYSLIYAGLSHYFPNLTMTQSSSSPSQLGTGT